MNSLRSISYFFSEASRNMLRGWRISLIGVLIIALGLFLCGLFWGGLASIDGLMEGWRRDLKVVVYLQQEIERDVAREIREEAAGRPWVFGARLMSGEEATQEFRQVFPHLAGLTDSWLQDPLPPYVEISLRGDVDAETLRTWTAELRQRDGVLLVDADQEWMDQLKRIVTFTNVAGWALGGLFLVIAAVTAAGVIRLIARMHERETAIMRLMGATELFVRGPFYAEGLLQGLIGGLLALITLLIVFFVLRQQDLPIVQTVLAYNPFGFLPMLAMIAIGGATGLFGAVISMRREEQGARL